MLLHEKREDPEERAQERRRFVRDADDLVRGLPVELEVELGLGPAIVCELFRPRITDLGLDREHPRQIELHRPAKWSQAAPPASTSRLRHRGFDSAPCRHSHPSPGPVGRG